MWNKYKLIKKNPYDKQPLNGLGLIIYSNWNDSFIKIIQKNNVKHLFLNYSLGWKCSNYSFLKNMPQIETLDIIDVHSKEIKSVEQLCGLTTLNLNVPNVEDIDYSVFHNLKNVFCYGNIQNDSLFACSGIEHLYIDNLKVRDNHRIANLKQLKSLTIANSNIESLEFFKELILLEKIALLNCPKIHSFSELSSLKKLKRLDIRGGKRLHDVSFLSNLYDIEIIIIETDRLVSIKPIAELKKIKALALFGKNFWIEDKDITPINNLEELSMLDIPNRICYPVKINNDWNWINYGIPRKKWLTKK